MDLDYREALRWRELSRGVLSHLTKEKPRFVPRGAGGGGLLDSAVTDRDARPHLMESHKGMQSPAFTSEKDEHGKAGALR